MALLQAEWIPTQFGSASTSPCTWVIASAAAWSWARHRAFQGVVIAYIGVPSFVVTLGGLLVWRGAHVHARPGPDGRPDRRAPSSCSAAARRVARRDARAGSSACLRSVGIFYAIFSSIAAAAQLRLPAAPVVGGGRHRRGRLPRVSAPVCAANSYSWPRASPASAPRRTASRSAGRAADPARDRHTRSSSLLVVGLVMTFIATRRRFGRYVFAIGGNPEAAELAGINTRRTIMKTFVVMGVLSRASARSSQPPGSNSAASGLGTVAELDVIAAAVIGGTSFAGGIGTIPGAVLGAVVMQSLRLGHGAAEVRHPGPGHRGRGRPCRRGRPRHRHPAASYVNARDQDCRPAAPMRRPQPPNIRRGIAGSGRRARAARRDARHPRRLRRRPRRRRRDRRPVPGRGRRPGRRQRRRQVDADAGAVRAPSAGHGRDPRQRRAGHDQQPARRQGATASRRSTRRSRWRTTSTRRPTCSSAARSLTRWGTLDDAAMEDATRKVMKRLNPNFTNFKAPVKSLSGGQRQSVAIARAVHFNAKVLIMDEPTAALGPAETAQVRDLVAPAEVRGHRHLPDQPRHPRRLRPRPTGSASCYHGRLVGTVDKDASRRTTSSA